MDHKLITIGRATVLLDRLESDETTTGWQVITTTYVDIDYKYDEWINFPDAYQARSFIYGYSNAAAQQFLERAQAWWIARQPTGLLTAPADEA